MRSASVRQGFAVSLAAFADLVYGLTVRELRTQHRNAALGILYSIAAPILAGLIFWVFMTFMGFRAAPIRADDLTFVLIGFFLFYTHIRAVSAVAGAIKPDMLNHQRATPFLFVCVKAFAAVYLALLGGLVLLALNWLLRDQWEMVDPLGFLIAFLGCWIGGVAAGMISMALTRYFTWGSLVQTVYLRVMLLTSGKFFVANSLPAVTRPFFDWNPLFHLLDQGRGAVFLNYTPRTTEMIYPFVVIGLMLVLGFLTEWHVRRHYNASHAAA